MGRKQRRLHECRCPVCRDNKSWKDDEKRLHAFINRLLAVSDERSRRLIAGVVWQMCKSWQMSEYDMVNDFRKRLNAVKDMSEESNSRLVAGVAEQLEQIKHQYKWWDAMRRAVEITGCSHNTIRKGMKELNEMMKLQPSELFALDRVGLRQ